MRSSAYLIGITDLVNSSLVKGTRVSIEDVRLIEGFFNARVITRAQATLGNVARVEVVDPVDVVIKVLGVRLESDNVAVLDDVAVALCHRTLLGDGNGKYWGQECGGRDRDVVEVDHCVEGLKDWVVDRLKE